MNPEVFTILTQFLYKIGEFIEILPSCLSDLQKHKSCSFLFLTIH